MEVPPEPVPTITEVTVGSARTPITEDHDEKYGIPTLDELGFETEGLKAPVWIGGETEALSKSNGSWKSISNIIINCFNFSAPGASFGAQSVGGIVRTSQNVTTISLCKPNGSLTISQIWMSINASLLL